MRIVSRKFALRWHFQLPYGMRPDSMRSMAVSNAWSLAMQLLRSIQHNENFQCRRYGRMLSVSWANSGFEQFARIKTSKRCRRLVCTVPGSTYDAKTTLERVAYRSARRNKLRSLIGANPIKINCTVAPVFCLRNTLRRSCRDKAASRHSLFGSFPALCKRSMAKSSN